MKPAELLAKRISELDDWRGAMLSELASLIQGADSDLELQWKWGTAVWAHSGNVCAAAAFKDHVKINFFNGAKLTDVQEYFNAGLDSKQLRAIDFYEGDTIDAGLIKRLVRAAINYNEGKKQ